MKIYTKESLMSNVILRSAYSLSCIIQMKPHFVGYILPESIRKLIFIQCEYVFVSIFDIQDDETLATFLCNLKECVVTDISTCLSVTMLRDSYEMFVDSLLDMSNG